MFQGISPEHIYTEGGQVCMKVKDVIKMLRADGWYLVKTRGDHHQFKHPTKPGRVTVPGNQSDDLAPGTLNSIWKQADLKGEK